MGSESSSLLASCSVDESPILTTPDWSLHHGQHQDHGQLSVFVDSNHTAGARIDKLAINLRLYRHPFILRYVDYCSTAGSCHLLTEKASPLPVVRRHPVDLSTCLGLYELTQAVMFLHQRGQATHNNICQSAVFVTPAGRWKLAGLEFLTKFSDPSFAEVRKSANDRYSAAIPPEEKVEGSVEQVPACLGDHVARDVFSLGVLITEVLSDSPEDHLTRQFKEFATIDMKHLDKSCRPTLTTVLNHPYFRQPYLEIVTFLTQLPLKQEEEKKVFFMDLLKKLKLIPENLLGLQLVPLLLSRYALMDENARSCVIPHILCPKKADHPPGLEPVLSVEAFTESVVPQIRTMFLVRDTQIRLTLLKHFHAYCSIIDIVTLEDDILPALLLGIRDTNKVIVSETLKALAELVPILGPEIVIGSNRKKIFTDGSPGRSKTVHKDAAQVKKSDIVVFNEQIEVLEKASENIDDNISIMKEDGEGEFENWDDWDDQKRAANNVDCDKLVDDDTENWNNWDAEHLDNKLTENFVENECDRIKEDSTSLNKMSTPLAELNKIIRNVQDLDIMKLDIKTNVKKVKLKSEEEELDFFADMAPTIHKKEDAFEKFENKLKEESREPTPEKQETVTKFSVAVDVDEDVDGWGGDDLDWGDDN